MRRRDDDAHGPDAEEALDAVLASEDLSNPHWRRRRGASRRTDRWPPRARHWQTSPAAQTPLAHTAGSASVQSCPGFRRHAPVALHVFVDAVQESVSSAFITDEHVPGTVPLQAMHELPLSHAV